MGLFRIINYPFSVRVELWENIIDLLCSGIINHPISVSVDLWDNIFEDLSQKYFGLYRQFDGFLLGLLIKFRILYILNTI